MGYLAPRAKWFHLIRFNDDKTRAIEMTKPSLPDINDLKGVIADYFDTMFPEHGSAVARDSVIAKCVEPFAKLISAWEMVDGYGAIEEQLWTAFMRDLFTMHGKSLSPEFEQALPDGPQSQNQFLH
jgi:hypothetical protein